jgi:Zn-dependent protease
MLHMPFDQMVTALVAVLAGLTVHELAHAWTALLLGDDTAKADGRITLNPIRHIDPFGFLLLLVAGFGWAKPVVINREKLRTPRRDDILISLAGPLSNLLLAFLSLALFRVLAALFTMETPETFDTLFRLSVAFAGVNIALGVFNLLPIPPLDGSHVLLNLLPPGSEAVSARYFKYGAFVLAGVIILESVSSLTLLPIGWMVESVMKGMLALLWRL